MTGRDIGVLLVDDSALMRKVFGTIIEQAEGLRLADKAMNGRFALEKLESAKPDVIVLDLEMPEMDGLEFLRERRRRGIDIPVVILSSIAHRGAAVTMEALALGASDFILKPSGADPDELAAVGDQLVQTLRAFGGRDRSTAAGERSGSAAAADRRQPTDRVDVVAIGISTGGPNALRRVFADLDSELPVPVLVVQHMPAGFTDEFAKSLDKLTPLSVSEARDGDVVKSGRVFIAPGNRHMTVERKRLADVIRLSQDDLVNGHRPSVDVLFRSVAAVYGRRCLAAVMTGMGRDGAAAIGDIYRTGGVTLAQDRESSVVYGMPRAAFESGCIDHVVPLDRMGETISRLVRSLR